MADNKHLATMLALLIAERMARAARDAAVSKLQRPLTRTEIVRLRDSLTAVSRDCVSEVVDYMKAPPNLEAGAFNPEVCENICITHGHKAVTLAFAGLH